MLQTIQDFIQDLRDVLEQEGKDMACYYTSGELEDTTYHKVAGSLQELLAKFYEVAAAEPKHGEQIYLSGFPLLYVEGAGLYYCQGQETSPIVDSIIEEFTTEKRIRLAYIAGQLRSRKQNFRLN